MIPLRCYTVVAASAAQTGAVDWFELTTTSAGGIALLGLDISQSTEFGDAQDEMTRWYVKRASSTYTSGSGGNSSVARTPTRAGDAAATFTAKTNNTTQIAVNTGTLTTVVQSCFNIRAGLLLFWTPETAITCSASQALAVGMSAAPADSVTWEATAYVGELLP
jgi:hypothetical protein